MVIRTGILLLKDVGVEAVSPKGVGERLVRLWPFQLA